MTRYIALICALAGFACLGCSESTPRGDCNPSPARGALGTVCGFENPEDVEVVAALDALVVSEMRHEPGGPGGALAYVDLRGNPLSARRLWPNPVAAPKPVSERRTPIPALQWLDPACADQPPADMFSPHGISARLAPGRDSVQLAVVSHSPREAIELFELRRTGAALDAIWLGCVPFPPDTIGNDVVFGAGDSLLATRYQPTGQRPHGAVYAILAGLGFDTGNVLRKRPGQDWTALPRSGGANPNGLVESPTTGFVFFSQTGDGSVTALRGDTATDVSIGGHPDNLAWSESGAILAVTHTDRWKFLRCVMGRRPCRTAWSLFEIDPNSLSARELHRGDGNALGAVASVSPHGERYFFGSVFDDRIGVWSATSNSQRTRHRP